MAYRKFADPRDLTADSQIGQNRVAPTADEPVRLGRDEWSVVDLARRDGLWSLNPDGLLPRLARLVFGLTPARPLANERLEALRRFAVAAWRRRVDSPHVAAFRSAGFSRAEVTAVLDHIGRSLNFNSWPQGVA